MVLTRIVASLIDISDDMLLHITGVSTKIHTIAHAYNTFGMAQQVVNEVNRELSFREDHEKCQWFIISTIRSVYKRVWVCISLC